MRIFCAKCASYVPAVQVSSDYSSETAATYRKTAVCVRFVFKGQPVDTYYLSPEFARTYSIEAGDLPLPDEYPVWTEEVHVVCASCFEQG
jgi:hypothetical protein